MIRGAGPNAICAELFAMLEEFSPEIFDIDLISNAIVAGFHNVDTTEAALKCATTITKKLTVMQEIFMTRVVYAVFQESMSFCSFESFQYAISFLQNLMLRDSDQVVLRCCGEAVQLICDDVSSDVVQGFVVKLDEAKGSSFAFCFVFVDFLIQVKKLTPDLIGMIMSKQIQFCVLSNMYGEEAAGEMIHNRDAFDADPPFRQLDTLRLRVRN